MRILRPVDLAPRHLLHILWTAPPDTTPENSVTDPTVTRYPIGVLVVNWPDEDTRFARIAREILDDIVVKLNDLNSLRLLLGYKPGDKPCGARSRDTDPMVCLLASSHVDDGHWHRGVGGSWLL